MVHTQHSLAFLVQALRLPFATASVIPVVFGAVLGLVESGTFQWMLFVVSLLTIVFVHLASNVANDYYDAISGTDDTNSQVTPFSGGSRVIQQHLLPAQSMLWLSIILFFVAGAGLGILFYATGSLFLLVSGAVGILLGIAYTKPPLKLSYRGLGEITIGITFGLLAPLFSYAVQAPLQWSAVIAVTPFVFTIIGIILINEFPDRPADQKAGKRTLVVRLGIDRSFMAYKAMLLIPLFLVVVLSSVGIIGAGSLLVLLLIPWVFRLMKQGQRYKHEYQQLIPVNARTIQWHIVFGILYTSGVFLSALV